MIEATLRDLYRRIAALEDALSQQRQDVPTLGSVAAGNIPGLRLYGVQGSGSVTDLAVWKGGTILGTANGVNAVDGTIQASVGSFGNLVNYRPYGVQGSGSATRVAVWVSGTIVGTVPSLTAINGTIFSLAGSFGALTGAGAANSYSVQGSGTATFVTVWRDGTLAGTVAGVRAFDGTFEASNGSFPGTVRGGVGSFADILNYRQYGVQGSGSVTRIGVWADGTILGTVDGMSAIGGTFRATNGTFGSAFAGGGSLGGITALGTARALVGSFSSGGSFGGAVTVGSYVDFPEIAAPAAPAADVTRIFASTTATQYLPISAQQAASATAFPLTAFESGSWTPTAGGIGGTDPTVTYTTQTGSYIRIGNVVILTFEIRINTVTTPGTGTMGIRGLPFTVSAIARENPLAAWSNITFSANYTTPGARAVPGTTTILFRESGTGVATTTLNATQWVAGTLVIGTLIYGV